MESPENRCVVRGSEDNYFGACPTCGSTDGYLNIGRGHWFVCDEHRVRWLAGANLFSDWRNESEETWRKNWDRIGDYRVLGEQHDSGPF